MANPEDAASLEIIEQTLKQSGRTYERLNSSSGAASLLLETKESDCVVEIFSDGRFACQFGVDMEEMRNLLTGNQTEDMADDELVRVARYHIRPIVDRHRFALLREGFVEEVDANPDYYAITFHTYLDLADPQETIRRMEIIIALLEKAC